MRHAAAASLLLALAATAAQARDPFEVALDVAGQTGSRGFASIERAVDTIASTATLQSLVPSYTEVSPATALVNLRGLGASVAFAAGSSSLSFAVPQAGIAETFNGATRAESAELLRRWLEGRGNSAVNGILRAAVRDTGVDPVAGNPNSLTSRMVAADFDRALDAATGVRVGAGFGARFASFTTGGLNSRNISLPLDYSWRLSDRDTLQLDAPLAYTDTEGAASYSGNLGLMWRRKVTPNWTLQPSLRIGAVGSRDLGSVAGAWSVALNSTLNLDLGNGLRLTVANGISHVSTIPVSIGRVSVDYDLSNTVFRNGLVLTRDLGFEVMKRPIQGAVFAVDTRYTGTAVYTRAYQEFGVTFMAGKVDPIRLGLTYLTGDHGIRGFTVNTGVVF